MFRSNYYKKSMSTISYIPHSHDGNDEEIGHVSSLIFYHLFLIINFGSVSEIPEYCYFP